MMIIRSRHIFISHYSNSQRTLFYHITNMLSEQTLLTQILSLPNLNLLVLNLSYTQINKQTQQSNFNSNKLQRNLITYSYL